MCKAVASELQKMDRSQMTQVRVQSPKGFEAVASELQNMDRSQRTQVYSRSRCTKTRMIDREVNPTYPITSIHIDLTSRSGMI